jgi:hypothetical protein
MTKTNVIPLTESAADRDHRLAAFAAAFLALEEDVNEIATLKEILFALDLENPAGKELYATIKLGEKIDVLKSRYFGLRSDLPARTA